MKFLEINGENLEEIYIDEEDNNLKLFIAKFCPNLKKLYLKFDDGELDILKTIFNGCQYLESIKILCGSLSVKEVLQSVAKYSPKSFYELKLHKDSFSSLCSKELEFFFISWKNRTPMKSLILNGIIIIINSEKMMKI